MMTGAEVTTLLRSKGFKATPQRLAVYEALSHTTAHPNADMLYRELVPHYPTMSLATVYKTLDILCEVGLAQELNVGEESFRYDATVESHPHVRCVSSGRVDDVPVLNDTALLSQAEIATGYDITGRQIYFYGGCPACAAKRKKQLH